VREVVADLRHVRGGDLLAFDAGDVGIRPADDLAHALLLLGQFLLRFIEFVTVELTGVVAFDGFQGRDLAEFLTEPGQAALVGQQEQQRVAVQAVGETCGRWTLRSRRVCHRTRWTLWSSLAKSLAAVPPGG